MFSSFGRLSEFVTALVRFETEQHIFLSSKVSKSVLGTTLPLSKTHLGALTRDGEVVKRPRREPCPMYLHLLSKLRMSGAKCLRLLLYLHRVLLN